VQEVAVARRATLLLGSQSIDWKVFEAAVTILDRRCKLYPTELPGYHQVQVQGASQFVRTISRCFHRDELGNARQPALSLETLVFELSGAKASDPRDKIYALLAIASDIDPLTPVVEPDYTKSSDLVYLDFYRFNLRSSGLDSVLRPLMWTESYPTSRWLYEANNSELAAPLIQPPGLPQVYSTGISGKSIFGMPPAVDYTGSIAARGFVLDDVKTTGVTNDTWQVPILRSWLAELTLDNYPRLITGLLPDDSQGLPYVDTVSLVQCFEHAMAKSRNDEDFMTLLSEHKDTPMITTSSLQTCLRSIQNLTRGRKLLRSTQGSVIGVGPAGTRRGNCEYV
jgi:hypothetical protein